MTVGGGPARREALVAATADPAVVDRFWSKVVTVEGSGCLWWTGAVSGRSDTTLGGGHGRLWLGAGRVVIAHRFAFALAHGVAELERAPLLGHRCDNPLCQRVAPGHVVVSSALQNRREWAARRRVTGTPAGDPRGARRRSRELRDLARRDPELVGARLAELRGAHGEQLGLW